MKKDLELLISGAATGAAFGCTRPTPLVGTPGAQTHGGNSTPSGTPVVEFSKSERSGERQEAK